MLNKGNSQMQIDDIPQTKMKKHTSTTV